MEEKNTIVAQIVCFQQTLGFQISAERSRVQFKYFSAKLLLKNYVISVGAVSHCQQLSIARYQVAFNSISSVRMQPVFPHLDPDTHTQYRYRKSMVFKTVIGTRVDLWTSR